MINIDKKIESIVTNENERYKIESLIGRIRYADAKRMYKALSNCVCLNDLQDLQDKLQNDFNLQHKYFNEQDVQASEDYWKQFDVE